MTDGVKFEKREFSVREAFVSAFYRTPRGPSPTSITVMDCIVLLLLGLLIYGVHGPAIVKNWGQVQWEDPLFLAHVQPDKMTPNEVFTKGSAWEGFYRPFSTNLIYRLDLVHFRGDLRYIHGLCHLVYLVNGWLLFRVGWVFGSATVGLIASALLVTRNAGFDVLLYASQLQTSLPILFGLVALLVVCHRGAWTWLRSSFVVLATLLALASKETSLILPVWCAVGLWHVEGVRAFRWRQLKYHLLPQTASVIAWFVWSSSRLTVVDTPHFKYDFSTEQLLGGLSVHLASFSNVVLSAPGRIFPCIMAQNQPSLMAAATSRVIAFGVVGASVCALVGWASRWGDPTTRTFSTGLLIAGIGVAPTLPLDERWLVYYGYAGHVGLALTIAAFILLALRGARRPGDDVRASRS